MRWLSVLLLGTSLVISASGLDFWDSKPAELLAVELTEAMTVQELASQVLMVAFPSPIPDENILSWIESRSLGGVKYFGWNAGTPVQVAEASSLLQARSQNSRFRIPLLVATDQEGGWVRHIKGGTTTTAGNLSLGASGLPHDAWKTASLLGFELRQVGINMNFAPTVDLYTNELNTVIGPRSFSQDPVESGVLGMAFFRGLKTQGVVATAKHFPGHGNTADDSHGKLPIIHDDRETLERRELVPFKMLIAEGLEAIMSGHIAFPEVAGNSLPASLNPELINGLLRQELGFQGVVLTDDLYMEGARPAGWTIAKAGEKALEAGNDLLLISKPVQAQRETWNALVTKAKLDSSFFATLKTAARRVVELKLKNLKGPLAVPLTTHPQALAIPAPDAEEFVLSATARGATVLASETLPWKVSGDAPLVITPYEGAWRALANRYSGAKEFAYPYEFFGFDPVTRTSMVAQAAAAARVVFVVATPGNLNYLKALEPFRDKLAVISVLSPVYLREVSWVKDAVAVYGTNSTAFEVAAAALAGDFSPRGRLPLRFGDFPKRTEKRP